MWDYMKEQVYTEFIFSGLMTNVQSFNCEVLIKFILGYADEHCI